MEIENKDILIKRFKEIINGKEKQKYLESTNRETRESIDTNKLILNLNATIGIKAKHNKAIDILKNSLIYNNTILERDELLNQEKMQTTSIDINKLDKIIKLLKTIKANFIKMSVENDAPLKLENDDFIFYIAPSQS